MVLAHIPPCNPKDWGEKKKTAGKALIKGQIQQLKHEKSKGQAMLTH